MNWVSCRHVPLGAGIQDMMAVEAALEGGGAYGSLWILKPGRLFLNEVAGKWCLTAYGHCIRPTAVLSTCQQRPPHRDLMESEMARKIFYVDD